MDPGTYGDPPRDGRPLIAWLEQVYAALADLEAQTAAEGTDDGDDLHRSGPAPSRDRLASGLAGWHAPVTR